MIDDTPKALFAALLVLTAATALWSALDRRSRAAAAARTLWRGRTRRLRLTGEGLAVAVTAAAALAAARRGRDALTVVLGTLTAWIGSVAFKIALGIPRPRHDTWSAAGGYGFPSGHTMVMVVACGLIVWATGTMASRRVRALLLASGTAVVAVTGVARMVADAHWLSDVMAGVALGTAWLNVVLIVAETRRATGAGVASVLRRRPA